MRRADPPSMDPGSGEWRPGDVRLWTKDELIAEITRLDGEIRRLEAWTDDRERLAEENARLKRIVDRHVDQLQESQRLQALLAEN